MSPEESLDEPAGGSQAYPPPWWGNLAIALVLTIAAAGAGLLAGSIA